MSFVSRRSPWMVPAPPGPDAGPKPDDALLRLLLSAAWRPRALAVSLAAGLGRIPDSEALLETHARIGSLLGCSRVPAELAKERGLPEAETCIAARLASQPLPSCASWAEILLADAVFGRALELGFGELAASADEAVAALPPPGPPAGGSSLAELAGDERNRECLQILVDRWAPAAARCLGRPGSPSEPALLESRTKPRPSEEVLATFLTGLDKDLAALGLWLPDAARMGITVPPGWTPARTPPR